jgi:hypothetical protein
MIAVTVGILLALGIIGFHQETATAGEYKDGELGRS